MTWLFIILLLILLVFLYSLIENRFLQKTDYYLDSYKINKELAKETIVCISDLHGYQFGKDNSRLIQKIKEVNPKLIMIAGDLITKKQPDTLVTAATLLEQLSLICPVYYALGNHEFWLSHTYPEDYQAFSARIQKAGVHLLDNTTELVAGGLNIAITGLTLPDEYFIRHPVPPSMELLTREIGTVSEQSYHILIAHNPDYFHDYSIWGANLILSGHMHGGIIRLPFIGGLVSPKFYLFPKYAEGLFKNTSSSMIVSRGLGTHTIPVRLFNRPEILVLHFESK